jgi:hypothetical protein
MDGLEIKPAGGQFSRTAATHSRINLTKAQAHVVSPFEFIEIAGDQAEAAISQIRRSHPHKTPILLADPAAAAAMFEGLVEAEKSTVEWLAMARDVDLDEWYRMRVAYWQRLQEADGAVVPPRGPWPRAVIVPTTLAGAWDDIGLRKRRVIIVLLPTAEAAEAPAFLSFGSEWEDCPLPPVLVALCRDWHVRFGAVPVTLSEDLMEFHVARPPQTRAAAERLALEHFHACPTVIEGTLQEYAARLVGAGVWQLIWE